MGKDTNVTKGKKMSKRRKSPKKGGEKKMSFSQPLKEG